MVSQQTSYNRHHFSPWLPPKFLSLPSASTLLLSSLCFTKFWQIVISVMPALSHGTPVASHCSRTRIPALYQEQRSVPWSTSPPPSSLPLVLGARSSHVMPFSCSTNTWCPSLPMTTHMHSHGQARLTDPAFLILPRLPATPSHLHHP